MASADQHGTKKKSLLTEIVARLEGEVSAWEQQLSDLTTQNTRVRARHDLLRSVLLARVVLEHLLGAQRLQDFEVPGPACVKLLALDQQVQALLRTFQPSGARSGAASTRSSGSSRAQQLSGVASGSTGGPQLVWQQRQEQLMRQQQDATLAALAAGGGAVGLNASVFAQSVVAASRSPETFPDKAAFGAWWGARTFELALLTHQHKHGAAGRNQLMQHLKEMSTRFSALLLSKPWAPEVFTWNMERGVTEEPPRVLWERAAAALAPSAEQCVLFEVLQDWWQCTAAALTRERQQLAQRALSAPEDVELQEAVLCGLERVNAYYLVLVTAMAVVAHTAMMTPEQLAEVYLACWPHMASMAGLFAAVLKMYPEGAF